MPQLFYSIRECRYPPKRRLVGPRAVLNILDRKTSHAPGVIWTVNCQVCSIVTITDYAILAPTPHKYKLHIHFCNRTLKNNARLRGIVTAISMHSIRFNPRLFNTGLYRGQSDTWISFFFFPPPEYLSFLPWVSFHKCSQHSFTNQQHYALLANNCVILKHLSL